MKIGKSILCVGLVSAMLMGCGVNNNDRFADNNNNNDGLTGVRYTPRENSYQNNDNFNTRNVGYNQNGTTNNGNGTMNNRGFDQNTKFDLADDIADRIDRLTEVDRAHVLLTNNDAYVAVRLKSNQNNRMTGNIETKITEIVKSEGNNIDNVYISENPEFFEHVHNYRNDIRSGRPVAGFFNDFGNMVERIFPNRAR